MAESILSVDVKEYTENGWAVREWPDGLIEARKHIRQSLTSYSTVGALYGYVLGSISLPCALNTDYYVGAIWQIGSGFTMQAGIMNKTTLRFNLYALGTAGGTQTADLWIYVRGTKV